ncbi:sensor of ECF-type sigma factor [Tenacibaculum bernardetii]|uniref:sensor of ECF-type sigma factor n=1 Tax=Tenacibaculum bernardetii TaxID=3021375 RepID=UPI0023AF0D35|nr:sensor of ECF-type sigma factor [Tenacibaculum bernardetii]
MKKQLLTLVFVFFLSILSSQAQSKKGSTEKIRTYKIAYLTEKLNLTVAEAQKFWPIYNQYDKKKMVLHREKRFNIKKRILKNGGIENLSEKDSKEILEKFQFINKQEYELKASFHTKVSKILSFKKILTLQISEHEFNRKLMQKYRGKKNKNKKEAE